MSNPTCCPRCHKNHPLEFKVLASPADGYTHWAYCPTTKEPVMASIGEEPKPALNMKWLLLAGSAAAIPGVILIGVGLLVLALGHFAAAPPRHQAHHPVLAQPVTSGTQSQAVIAPDGTITATFRRD